MRGLKGRRRGAGEDSRGDEGKEKRKYYTAERGDFVKPI